MRRVLREAVIAAAGVTGIVLLTAGTALAHIEPDPIAAQAGTSATVSFKVEHGCAGSPTTSLDIKIPDTVTDAAAVNKDGWTATLKDGVLTFAGGPLDANTADVFTITFTAPAAPGDLAFPIVQRCQSGETDWIAPTVDGQPEPEHPAPVVRITQGPPTSAELVPPHEDNTDNPTGSTPASTVSGGSTPISSGNGTKSDDSHTGTIVIIIVAAVLVFGGAGYVVRKRGSAPPPKNRR